jgi:predicted lysophospholipase L1 biosynthesis ABC-type transport system permease subunit
VTSYSIARRTSAIGVGIALGARRADILEHHLNDISSDPVSLALAVAGLFTSAVAAVFLPARRAMRIDPIGALREE